MTHAFLSYSRSDHEIVDRLVADLHRAGIEVWIDRERISPGARWKAAIRDAIRNGSFFLACFSQSFLTRERSYVYEELTVAIEELRQRPSDRAWFIPISLDGCEIPPRAIGGGETLKDIQWCNLGDSWETGVESLVGSMRRESVDRPALPPATDGESTARSRNTSVTQKTRKTVRTTLTIYALFWAATIIFFSLGWYELETDFAGAALVVSMLAALPATAFSLAAGIFPALLLRVFFAQRLDGCAFVVLSTISGALVAFAKVGAESVIFLLPSSWVAASDSIGLVGCGYLVLGTLTDFALFAYLDSQAHQQ